ncbi:MAG: GyrI-like domain-containing protein, partial [Armatimonadetes bacterium]|nr:GyrI-like domain-containing protein [Armatimonadota bacterium]
MIGYACGSGAKIAGPPLDLWLDRDMPPHDMSVEACAPISAPVPPSDRVTVYGLPGVPTVACTVHHGPLTPSATPTRPSCAGWSRAATASPA